MKYILLIFLGSFLMSFNKIVIPVNFGIPIVKDTTVNNVWDGGGKEFSGYRVHGTGTLQNWDINVSVNSVLADISINFVNIKTFDGRFSTKWYGISSSNADNWGILQKSINVAKANRLICYTPGGGVYKYSQSLKFGTLVNGTYQQSFNRFIGDASYWDNGSGTTFQFTGTAGVAMSLQLQKGSIFSNFALFGLYKVPSQQDGPYFSLTEAGFTDKSGFNIPDTYTGLGLDYYYDGHSRSGSTGITITNVSIGNFGVALGFSQNGMTLNNEAHTISNIHFFDNKYCIQECNAQEKGTTINNIYSWGSCYNVVNIGLHGSHQAGNYSYNGANIAGRCIEVVHASIGHWFSSSFSNWYCENIGRVISFYGQMPFTFYNCNFDLNFFIGTNRDIIYASSNLVFHGCTIRYYDGLIHNIRVQGQSPIIGYPDNYFGGGGVVYD